MLAGSSWLREHVRGDYIPAWHDPLSPGHYDAAIATTSLSRWHNYYLEGINWMIRNTDTDGVYLDGIGFDREIMKRLRKVLLRAKPAAMLAALPEHITWLPTEAAEREVADAPADACHLVLTHRHDLDLKIIDAVLRRADFRFAGLIGSQTKRARFLHRLAEQGIEPDTLERLTCPIGLPDIQGKEPAVIAIAVVAQLLAEHAA